ncbi:MAG: serine/threonine protein kinase [Archangiaceae bacterium]|nr:serine/threonine protein kinase [Archangiaceae bacterium]
MAENSTALEVGSKVSDTYEVVRLIGRGGMGEVWLARHLRLPGKQVAIKVLHTRAGGLSTEALARFKREAEVATRIGHPNIVEVHDYNTLASGAPYLVLEFLQGESLAARLRFGAMPFDEVTALIRQVGSALDASHRAGVVHRDLKPDNIFLVPGPMGVQVKVLDFGISKVVASSTLQTAEEVLVGTPQYMSPEQAVGHNKDVGPQTDVFALGSIAYEMLSGQPAFTAESVAKVVFRIAYEQHTPLAQVKPGLPERAYTAVERALQKDKALRYDSIAAFIAELTGQPVPRTQPPATASSEPSGVATPGVATPDSLAWGATAQKTPAAPLEAPRAAPAPRSGLRYLFAALAAVALGAAAFALWRPPTPAPAPVTVAPPPAPLGVTLPPPVPPPEAEPPALAPAPAVKPAAPAAKKLSPSDLALLAEAEQRLAEEATPLRRVQQLLQKLESDAAVQRAYVLAGLAACKERDLSNAAAYLAKVAARADKNRLKAGCKKLDMELLE